MTVAIAFHEFVGNMLYRAPTVAEARNGAACYHQLPPESIVVLVFEDDAASQVWSNWSSLLHSARKRAVAEL